MLISIKYYLGFFWPSPPSMLSEIMTILNDNQWLNFISNAMDASGKLELVSLKIRREVGFPCGPVQLSRKRLPGD